MFVNPLANRIAERIGEFRLTDPDDWYKDQRKTILYRDIVEKKYSEVFSSSRCRDTGEGQMMTRLMRHPNCVAVRRKSRRRIDLRPLMESVPRPLATNRISPEMWISLKAVGNFYLQSNVVDAVPEDMMGKEASDDSLEDFLLPFFRYIEKICWTDLCFSTEEMLDEGMTHRAGIYFTMPFMDYNEENSEAFEMFLSGPGQIAVSLKSEFNEMDDDSKGAYFSQEDLDVIEKTGGDFKELIEVYTKSKLPKLADVKALRDFGSLFTPVVEKYEKLQNMQCAIMSDNYEEMYIEAVEDIHAFIEYHNAFNKLMELMPQVTFQWSHHYYYDGDEPGMIVFIKDVIRVYREEKKHMKQSVMKWPHRKKRGKK